MESVVRSCFILIHYGPVAPCDNTALNQHWLGTKHNCTGIGSLIISLVWQQSSSDALPMDPNVWKNAQSYYKMEKCHQMTVAVHLLHLHTITDVLLVETSEQCYLSTIPSHASHQQKIWIEYKIWVIDICLYSLSFPTTLIMVMFCSCLNNCEKYCCDWINSNANACFFFRF